MIPDNFRIIPMRVVAGSVWQECDVDHSTAWSVEEELEDGSWYSHEVMEFYDDEHKWDVLEDARRLLRDIVAREEV